MFRDKIGHTAEVYIDDMVMKSRQEVRHIEDLQGVFEVLWQHKLHLNAEKCTFGVEAGKFLGYLITCREIEVNPDQIEAVKRLRPMSNPKKVQVLTEMLATFNRFISKFADRCCLLEKLVLALIHATRKLPHYSQAHTVYVLTEYPLQSLLKRSDFTGRIANWGTRLGAFEIRYKPRSLVKG